MSTSAAIAAAAMRCRTMADGSLRIEVEVEPGDAQAAFALFGMPGAPMALAALKVGHAAASDEPIPGAPAAPIQDPEPTAKLVGGARSKLAARWGDTPDFQFWLLSLNFSFVDPDPELRKADALGVLYQLCHITSRVQLDHDELAADRFDTHIRHPYKDHLERRK